MVEFPIAYLNSNDGTGLLAFGEGDRFLLSQELDLNDFQKFIDKIKGSYVFGYLSYDLKNQLHGLTSNGPDHLSFPELFFWIPKYVVNLHKENIDFLQGERDHESMEFINQFLEEETDQNYHHLDFQFKPRITKEKYIENVIQLKDQIQKGNIYEVTYCQEFYAEDVKINFPLDTYFKLNQLTKAPYSSFLKFDEYSVFCGSPERFLKRTENKLISQPIKGTSRRGATPEEDDRLKSNLEKDPKERAENVMIVDLVRNDLSRVAADNSVNVDELCKIYTFDTVHQMISTISCEVRPEVKFTDILKATYPMGSMTGAPKLRAMQLIEEFESFKRGIFSGSVGYIAPNGDFDFNVVIRSLLYNQKTGYLSCPVGGAIISQSDPEKEYEECFVKIKRILDGMNE